MKIEDQGGAAFPRATEQSVSGWECTLEAERGMTLRDYFAAKALAASISHSGIVGLIKYERAQWAYNMADVMLEMRTR